jgi:hypothetical protein
LHSLLNPKFTGKKNYFKRAIERLISLIEDAARNCTSSMWNRDIIDDLKSRPNLKEGKYFGPSQDRKCDLCRRKHKPTTVVTLSGAPYDHVNLTNVDTDDEGHIATATSSANDPEELEFITGAKCVQLATDYHRLFHWRTHLLKDVRVRMIADGHYAVDSKRERHGYSVDNKGQRLVKSESELLEHVEGILEELSASGFVTTNYRTYRFLLNLPNKYLK